MVKRSEYDAVVIGSGPNGLAAAIEFARAGRKVVVFEAKDTVGGGMRSQELTLPGFVHDVCSAVHPLGLGSPFFRKLPLEQYGLHWIQPDAPLAHPLDDGTAILMERSMEATAAHLGVDAAAYRKLMTPLVNAWPKIDEALLGPLRFPHHPLALARFGLSALRSARGLAQSVFKAERAQALLAGLSAHSMLSLRQPPSAAFGLVLGMLAHSVGWPIPQGGSQHIANALAAYFLELGGEIETGVEVEMVADLPAARAVLFDVTPRQLLSIAGNELSSSYRRQLEHYRYGPGVFKLDYALDRPLPWKAAECGRAGTVHLGGTLAEICAAEEAVARGENPEKPFVLLVQSSLFDSTRAPAGKHTLWAYCHVPNGSTFDMTARIEAQIERFAPGFGPLVLARHSFSPAQMHAYNSNYVGGDINGGLQSLTQLFTRPSLRLIPYTTSAKRLYICSASTPPGGGVHGMGGYFAAQAALKRSF